MKHALMTLGFLILFGFLHLNFITTLGDNVMNVQRKDKSIIQFLFPQGWGFFTRDPREPKYKLYRMEGGAPKLVNFQITSSKNSYGFSRLGSRIGMEMQRVKEQLPPPATWQTSTVDLEKMQLDSIAYPCTKPIAKEKLHYIKAGNYILKEYQLSPWSWAKYQGRYSKTFKYVPFQLIKS